MPAAARPAGPRGGHRAGEGRRTRSPCPDGSAEGACEHHTLDAHVEDAAALAHQLTEGSDEQRHREAYRGSEEDGKELDGHGAPQVPGARRSSQNAAPRDREDDQALQNLHERRRDAGFHLMVMPADRRKPNSSAARDDADHRAPRKEANDEPIETRSPRRTPPGAYIAPRAA